MLALTMLCHLEAIRERLKLGSIPLRSREPQRAYPCADNKHERRLVRLHARPQLALPVPLRTASRVRVRTSPGRFLSISAISAPVDVK